MKIITIDGNEWIVKYKKNAESVSFETGTTVSNYPNFKGSKINQNSSGSDKYQIVFAIHKTQLVSFKSSFKSFVVDKADAVIHKDYDKLTHIILEHPDWGAIKGGIIGGVSFATSSEADILVSCAFQEHTDDKPIQKKDFEYENETANELVDLETDFDVELSGEDKTRIALLADNLANLYKNIQNSKIVQAFNNLNSELSKTLLDSKRIMNSVKGIISLPNEIFLTSKNKLEMFQKQANAIKEMPITTYNIALFNVNSLSFNIISLSRTAYISDSAKNAAAGIKTVPLT